MLTYLPYSLASGGLILPLGFASYENHSLHLVVPCVSLVWVPQVSFEIPTCNWQDSVLSYQNSSFE